MACSKMSSLVSQAEEQHEDLNFVDNLPESLLLEIFSFLKLKDRCRCACVCKKWNRIAKDRSLLKVIDATERHLTFKQLQGLVNNYCTAEMIDFRMLSRMVFNGIPKRRYDGLFKNMMKKSPHLQRLTIIDYNIHIGDFYDYHYRVSVTRSLSIESFPATLVHLSVRDPQKYPQNFFGFTPEFYVPNLRCLDIGTTRDMTSCNLGVFSKLANLQCLNLDRCDGIDNDGISAMKDLLPQLKVLNIVDTDVENDGVIMILENCCNIEELFICFTRITDEVFFNLKKKIVSSLKKLCIRHTKVTDQAILHFVSHTYTGAEITVSSTWDAASTIHFENQPNCIINCKKTHWPLERCMHFKDHVCRELS